MAEFNLNDMEQARRRVMEMQRRSQNYMGTTRGTNPAPRGGEATGARKPTAADESAKNARDANVPPAQGGDTQSPVFENKDNAPRDTSAASPLGQLKLLGMSSDRTLILLLLILLMGEDTDRLLLLALLYCGL